ncbi:glycerol kinase GlpK [symbiont of Argiope bruennichi]|uniref:FGGY-family carbohydrate kinase n=1 Tax=symbiont of Argiope bruennichi TaxID=2810479 RepID=UPI003DA55C9C
MKQKKFILVIDCGTTYCKAIIFNHQKELVFEEKLKINQYYLNNNWVEQDPIEIWNTIKTLLLNIVNKNNIDVENILSIGITNQRESVVIWDKNTGYPIYNVILWQDQRTNKYCQILKKNQRLIKLIQNKTGLILNSYFSATKVKWLLDNVISKEKNSNKTFLFGTIDTWILYNLTNKKSYFTDVTNASRTMLFDIKKLSWDDKLMEIFSIKNISFPKVLNSSDFFGTCNSLLFSKQEREIPITAMVGDQQAALFGACCFEMGEVKITYGTGAFILVNLKHNLIYSKHNLLTSVAAKFNDEINYVLEGSIFFAGLTLEWIVDKLKLLENYEISSKDINWKNINNFIYLVPGFNGIGAPHWDDLATATIFNLSLTTRKEDFLLAGYNSIAFQCLDIINAIKSDVNFEIKEIIANGGIAKTDYLLKFQAEISNIIVKKMQNIELSGLGCAFLSGLYVKFWNNLNELKNNIKVDKIFLPTKQNLIIKKKCYQNWKKSVKRSLNWKN